MTIVSDTKGAWGFPREGNLARPHPAEFMGQASLELELPPQEAVVRETALHLAEDPDTVRRQVRGSIRVKYEWSPKQLGKYSTEPKLQRLTASCIGFYEEAWGILKVTVVSGDRLINLHCQRGRHCLQSILHGPVLPDVTPKDRGGNTALHLANAHMQQYIVPQVAC